MTTKIVVDAHAGWPVAVARIFLDGTKQELPIVEPNTIQEFHIWDGCDLRVSELKRPAEEPETK